MFGEEVYLVGVDESQQQQPNAKQQTSGAGTENDMRQPQEAEQERTLIFR